MLKNIEIGRLMQHTVGHNIFYSLCQFLFFYFFVFNFLFILHSKMIGHGIIIMGEVQCFHVYLDNYLIIFVTKI